MKSMRHASIFKRSALCTAIGTLLSISTVPSVAAPQGEPILFGLTERPVIDGSASTDPAPFGTVNYKFLVGGAIINATYNVKDRKWSGTDVVLKGWTASAPGSTLTYSSLSGETVVITGIPVVQAGTLDKNATSPNPQSVPYDKPAAGVTGYGSQRNVKTHAGTIDSQLLGDVAGLRANVTGGGVSNARYDSSQPYTLNSSLDPRN
jgi:hypothetical protein